MTLIEQFEKTMRGAGVEPTVSIIADGKLHRFTIRGDRPNSNTGFYVLHTDDPAAGQFGCWKRGISETWCSKAYQSLTHDEQARYTANMEAAKAARDAELQRIQAECRKWCREMCEKCRDATNDHPYLKRKNVNTYGLKILKETLLVPLRDVAGTLHGLQFIQPDGSKRFKSGTDKSGHFFAIGKLRNDIFIIGEGYATCASIHQATGHCTIVAFDSGNLLSVAQAVRKKHPDSRIILAADNDQWTDGNPGLTKATEASRAVNGLLAVPVFKDVLTKPTDFNDLHQLEGLGTIRRQVEQARQIPQDNGTNEVGSTESGSQKKPLPFTYRRLSDIQAKAIRWLWPGRIARGKVSMLAGHPGLGKSQLTASLAAIVTTGDTWPVDKTQCERGNVIFFSAEDDAEDTIRPRLEAAGADLDRIYILDAVRDENRDQQRAFNLTSDLPRLGEMLEFIGDVALIIIDPITAYLGGTDSHKNSDIRALLSPLGELAAKHEAAVVCVSHLNKGGGGEAMMRVSGSLAFVAAARAAFLIVRDKVDKHRRLFLPLKNNIGNDKSGLAFSVESHNLPAGIETSRISWAEEPVTISADEAMSAQSDPVEQSALDNAIEFLSDLLADGPVSSKQIKTDAEGAGHSWRTIERAKIKLEVNAYKGGMKEGWLWRLPAKDAINDEEHQEKNMAVFGKAGGLRSDSAMEYMNKDQSEEAIPQLTEDDLQSAGWL